ncbi:MAG: hypothetical protein LBJ60_00610 [Tannerellaceae bacterium]|nr:hypothetical protein [Tannerellaceae bacterium]
MTGNIKTVKDAETALFAYFLKQSGQSTIDDFMSELKANKTFSDTKYYSRLKAGLSKKMGASEFNEKNDLMQELETQAFNIAKYAR